jgi:hypothetical protein
MHGLHASLNEVVIIHGLLRQTWSHYLETTRPQTLMLDASSSCMSNILCVPALAISCHGNDVHLDMPRRTIHFAPPAVPILFVATLTLYVAKVLHLFPSLFFNSSFNICAKSSLVSSSSQLSSHRCPPAPVAVVPAADGSVSSSCQSRSKNHRQCVSGDEVELVTKW